MPPVNLTDLANKFGSDKGTKVGKPPTDTPSCTI
jgi:hypothetical protein